MNNTIEKMDIDEEKYRLGMNILGTFAMERRNMPAMTLRGYKLESIVVEGTEVDSVILKVDGAPIMSLQETLDGGWIFTYNDPSLFSNELVLAVLKFWNMN